MGRISCIIKNAGEGGNETVLAGIELAIKNRDSGEIFRVRTNSEGYFSAFQDALPAGDYEFVEIRAPQNEAEYAHTFHENAFEFTIQRDTVNNLGRISWVYDRARQMSDFEFVKDPQEIREMFFAHRHRAWNNIDIRENTSELQHPEDTLDIVWNLSNLGFGGYYGGSSLLPGTGSVFNIYFEDSVSKFGIKISPFTFFNSGNQIAGGGLTGASLSFLNLDLYWNPLFSVSGNGIFGPFISLNYLTYNRRESNFWTNVSAAAGWRLTLMTELSKDHWGILGKDSVGLGGYHNTLVGIDAGYRYLNGDHYLYFEIGTDLVNIVYAATIAASLVMLFSSPGQNTEKTK